MGSSVPFQLSVLTLTSMAYFKSSVKIKSPHGTPRFETVAGKQAQLDWKENIDFLTSDGEIVNINVAVLVLSHSRFRFFHLSLNKTQESLFPFLTQCFEKIGGVPEQLITDNMKTVVELLYELTEHELKLRAQNAINAFVRVGNFPHNKGVEDFDFSFQPTVTPSQMSVFAQWEFLKAYENIIFIGPSGVGKTHLATAIGLSCAKTRERTYFIKCHDLIQNLRRARLENRLDDRLKHYSKYKLLIIDELGYLPISDEDAKLFFQLVDKRYEKKSTFLTTNVDFKTLGEMESLENLKSLMPFWIVWKILLCTKTSENGYFYLDFYTL